MVEFVFVNWDVLWVVCNGYFFKFVVGFGSCGSYWGDKLIWWIWVFMVLVIYIVQVFVLLSMWIVYGGQFFKVDVCCFVFEVGVLLFVVRLYQGQIMNMCIFGGGFVVVFMLLWIEE